VLAEFCCFLFLLEIRGYAVKLVIGVGVALIWKGRACRMGSLRERLLLFDSQMLRSSWCLDDERCH